MLLNGDHAKIRKWRREQSLLTTLRMRPDLFETAQMTDKEREAEILRLEKEMKEAAKLLEFEYAAILRDRIMELKGEK